MSYTPISDNPNDYDPVRDAAPQPAKAAQPDTSDVQAALDKRKAITRKLHGEMQEIIARREKHHPSCRESDKDLVWHCSQCGENESAYEVEAELERVKAERDAEQKAKLKWAANARKIAQQRAELLAAAKAARKANNCTPDIDKLLDAAIAKAEGRAS